MPEFSDDRARLAAVRNRLEEWILVAREEAYEDVFDGPDSVVSGEDLATLDRLDSELSRNGDGLWGTDQYGIIGGEVGKPTSENVAGGAGHAGRGDEETRPLVVCTYHPQIPEADPFARSVDDDTSDRLNDSLWTYCERVVEHAQRSLDDFVWDGDPPPGRRALAGRESDREGE